MKSTWNDDKELPDKVVRKIIVHDFYLRNRTRLFWAASIAIGLKFFPFDFLGRTINRLSSILIMFFSN